MKGLIKSALTISALSSVVIAPLLMNAGQASAQTQKGTDASYIGAGVAGGVTNGGQPGQDAQFAGNVTGRLKLGPTPFSARTQILFTDQTTAIIPQVSIDAPIAKGTNVYLAGGYSFVETDGKQTPLGDRDGVALTAGVESEVAKNFMLYGNTTLGMKTYQNSPASAVSIQGGVGYRFR
ncbi:outer membrane beta-barrel protein [Calothrix sp. FACHB-1219]|uniref:outer membrane beta-barrel protein n=1 Tax=unclassified Calothrix TaxID=2619626 RepID=UPI0016833165|nr:MULTISPECIES: outer membrane beta-barrel protein [unclassified Calothrix]MBD2204878.1 outer membrane beta-barrel protein [Calothrix sp. FACHB-168]MBD2216296.1 outer membrane beta-barrel protein [Calothrix sp. FACHB-1219]